MFGPLRYGALYAKIHARLGHRLSPQTWDELLEAEGFSEFVNRLAQTPYGPAVERFRAESAQNELQVARLERVLRGHWTQQSLSLFYYLQGKASELLEWYWRRFELNNLKTVLRAVEGGVAAGRAESMLIPLGSYARLDWSALLEADSVPDLVDALSGTFYGDTMKPALSYYQQVGRLLVLEARLDLAYFYQLLDLIRALHGRDREAAERFLGMVIDGQNVLWAFRYRTFYDLSPEEILNYCLHDGIQVDVGVIKQIAMGAPLVEILQDLWQGRLSGVSDLAGLADAQALSQAEAILDRYLLRQAEQVRAAYAMHLGIVLAYEVLLEIEIRNLIRSAEGKAAHWDQDQIRPYLISVH